MVGRVCAIVSDRDPSLAFLPAVARRFIDKRRGRVIRADLEVCPRGQQVRERRERVAATEVESLNQRPDKEVVVDVLEQADTLGADITNLKDVVAIRLTL